MSRPTIHLTAAEWVAAAEWAAGDEETAVGVLWRIIWWEADGRDFEVEVPADAAPRTYGLRGPRPGSLTVFGPGPGDAVRVGEGAGDALRRGAGSGDALRDGSGGGDACCFGEGAGHAIRDGEGPGDARRLGAGAGSASRRGTGSGGAARDGPGAGAETDRRGTRRRVLSAGIPYDCAAGDGHLRVGCEVHPYATWLDRAEEIDARHDSPGLAPLTRALAVRCRDEEERENEEVCR